MPSLDALTLLLQQYGYILLFPIAVIEGPIVGVLAGFLAAAGYMNAWIAFWVLVAGDMLGDILYYALGRWGGRALVTRYGAYVGITTDRMEELEAYQHSRSMKVLLLVGKTQPTGSIILVAAGIARMPFWDFCWYNLVGTIPKVGILEAAGYFFGDSVSKASDYLDTAGIYSFLIGTLLLGLYFLVRRYTKSLK